MKTVVVLILSVLSLSAFANEPTSFAMSDACMAETRENSKMQAALTEILAQVEAYKTNTNIGYSEETGQILVNMVCAPFDREDNEKDFDLCESISFNIDLFEATSGQKGYGLETAMQLNRMAGAACL